MQIDEIRISEEAYKKLEKLEKSSPSDVNYFLKKIRLLIEKIKGARNLREIGNTEKIGEYFISPQGNVNKRIAWVVKEYEGKNVLFIDNIFLEHDPEYKNFCTKARLRKENINEKYEESYSFEKLLKIFSQKV